jgi:PAS domain S-box-containing protein
VTFENRYRHEDGSYRWLFWKYFPIPEERVFYAVASDITEQKKLEAGLRESQAYSRGLLESSIDGLVAVDRALTVTDINQIMCRMAGRSREEIIGSAFPGYFTEPERAGQSVRQTFEQGSVIDYILTLQTAGGKKIPVSFNAAVFRDASGEVQGIVAAARDITERRKAEAALSRYAEELKRSNQELEDFATVASHDLQEPLRKITVFGERLHQHCSAAFDERGRGYLQRMEDAARRMSGLINGLLEFSRVARKGRDFEPTDLNVVVAGVLSDLESSIEEAPAEVIVEPLPMVMADRLQMRQLFQNLLSNALKFRRPQEAHRVTIGARPAGDAGWEVRVGDNGIGFEERFVDRIFKPFQRLHGRGEYEGHGMGLAVCDKIVRRHGWLLAAHSRPGQGSDFIVTIPKRLEPREEPAWTARPESKGEDKSSSLWPKTMTTISH